MSVMDSIEEKYQDEIAKKDKQIKILELKNRGSLANNLCPDCRDKQAGGPCLACTIQRQDKQIAALKAERDLLKKHQAICECGGLSIDHNLSDNHQVSDMISPCPFKEQIAGLKEKDRRNAPILRDKNELIETLYKTIKEKEGRDDTS